MWQALEAYQTDLLLASMVLVWGANFSIVKAALSTLSPLAFNAVRFSLATALLAGILRRQGKPLGVARADVWKVIVLGLLGHGFYQIFFIEGLARTTAANSSLIMATVPVFVALLSAALRLERITLRRWIGIFLSFLGIFLVILGGGGRIQINVSSLVGDLLILSAALTWGVYTVFSKPLLARYSPLHLTAITMVSGTALLILAGVPALIEQSWAAVAPSAWAGLVYSAVFAIAIAYLIWFTAVQRVGNAYTAVYSNGTPVVASLLAWLVLREPFRPLQAIGGVVILIGLALARSRSNA